MKECYKREFGVKELLKQELSTPKYTGLRKPHSLITSFFNLICFRAQSNPIPLREILETFALPSAD